MTWKVSFYSSSVEDAILDMPPKIQARMLSLLELVEKHGANLGAPQPDLDLARKRQSEVKNESSRFKK